MRARRQQACVSCLFYDSKAYRPHLGQLSSRTNSSALLAVSMLPFIGTGVFQPNPLPVPSQLLPGVPITQRASNPTRAFLNFRGTSADEGLDLWLADGTVEGGGVVRAGRCWGLLQRGGRACCCCFQHSPPPTPTRCLWQLGCSLTGVRGLTCTRDLSLIVTQMTR